MTSNISFGRKSAVGVTSIGPGGSDSSSKASAALGDVAARVAASIASELKLADGVGSRQSQGGSGDPYAIDDIARELANRLGGNGIDAGHLARALHEFATQSASLIGARPGSGSFETISAAVTAVTNTNGATETVASAIAAIEQTTISVKGG